MVVHINLDETCVKLCPCVPRGAVAIDGGSTKKEALEQEHKASLHARRSAMTFVCSVCDDTIVQRALPQVIIGNERVLPLSAADILNKKHTGNIFVLRQKSSSSAAGNVIFEVAESMNNALPKDPLCAQIEALRKEQQDIKEKKKRLQKDLRNAERKKRRLSERARRLSDKDLVAVLMMRKNQRDARGGQPVECEAGALGLADAASAASSSDDAVKNKVPLEPHRTSAL